MEDFIKIAGVMISIFALYKLIVDVVIAKASKHREEYQFSKDYVLDLGNSESHSFVLEKGFLALTGQSSTVPEIKYLLSLNNPSKVINLKSASGKFINFNLSDNKYSWNEDTLISEKIVSYWYIGLYIVFAFITITPLLLKNIDITENINYLIICAACGFIAISSLLMHEESKSAKLLIKEVNNA